VTVLATSVEFTLPRGYLDATGTWHQDGEMRLATAADEILPLRDPRVEANPAYLTVILLSRVIVRLGDVNLITPATIERMFAADVSYLQDLYNELNDASPHALKVTCPNCEADFDVERPSSGES
jgi:hypothetical protein